jgi:hypothetical protein
MASSITCCATSRRPSTIRLGARKALLESRYHCGKSYAKSLQKTPVYRVLGIFFGDGSSELPLRLSEKPQERAKRLTIRRLMAT